MTRSTMYKNVENVATIDADRLLNIDEKMKVLPSSPSPTVYEFYGTLARHPRGVRCAAFTGNGEHVATGGVESHIKVYDLSRLLTRSFRDSDDGGGGSAPQPRVITEHQSKVSVLRFYPDPNMQLLISGSSDATVRIFDLSRPSFRRCLLNIVESEAIRTIELHPSGRYMWLATRHPTIRLYDLATAHCFVSSDPSDQHLAPVNSISYSPDGRMLATGSKDGAMKIWDGRTSKAVQVKFIYNFNGVDRAPSMMVRHTNGGLLMKTLGK